MRYHQTLDRSNAALDALGHTAERLRLVAPDLDHGAQKLLENLLSLGESIGLHAKALLIKITEQDEAGAQATCDLLDKYLDLSDTVTAETENLLGTDRTN